ncbi:prolyl 3-hydroxylase OGFOD1-like [Mya arenaria]|uniref:prolyl 3-hydroxylase OGFOD1-like n=1 Tax=Mya arenaria TaxID=6604 RepID=UPI0022E3DED5|nr:prolyl 3-hydroxylase OGFOD1-like [Mya arenaria]
MDGPSKSKQRKTRNAQLEEINLKNVFSLAPGCSTSKLKESWSKRKDFSEDATGLQLSQEPFCHCMVPGFLSEEKDIEQLKDELMDLEFVPKNNDLYKFIQSSEDLKTSKSPMISAFRNALCTRVRMWLTEVTGIPLNETVDAFCAKYAHTDTLLCHDDELEGRRIAYIYYIVNDWAEADGGALDLFSVDENIQPKEVVKSILPAKNNFVFFEVSPGSYHQVAEVLSEDKTRLSISGWFHGPPIERPTPYLEPTRALLPYGDIEDEEFFDWINPVYLSPGAQGSIQEKFENDSEIELQDFLLKEKYDLLLEALKSSNMKWQSAGPANKRCFKEADDASLPDVVSTCVRLFRSDAMFLLLSNLTGLKLHELAAASSSDSEGQSEDGEGAEEADKAGSSKSSEKKKDLKDNETKAQANETAACKSRCRTCVRHWGHCSYTLVHDTNTEGAEFALDLVLYVGCADWDMEYGGFTSYIAKGEDEELLTVTPEENSLALVYRDQETLKFVKYLNTGVNKMQHRGFYDIYAVYFE